MAVNFLVPLLIPLGEQITNVSELRGSGTLVFGQPDQTVTVAENNAPTLLTVLSAHSNTTRGPVSYEIVGGDDIWLFYAHPHSGNLVLSKPLDYEMRHSYDVFVGARAGSEKTYGRVVVNVTDVNDNAPTFPRPLFETQVTEEDDRHLPRQILQVAAHDADESDRDNLRYSLMLGQPDAGFFPNATSLSANATTGLRTGLRDKFNTSDGVVLLPVPEIPPNSTETDFFAIDPKTGDITFIRPLDRDAPLGRPHWFLWLGVTDGRHTSTARLLVNVKDVNDNAPFFPLPVVTAFVKENSKAGLHVVTVEAEDYDDPAETGHASVTYAIDKNVIDEATRKPIFAIDANSGRISTALCCLDREKTASYHVQVVATDGGGLKGTGGILVLVEDENDVLPVFSAARWHVEVEEGVPPGRVLALLTVEDDDVTNQFSYRIVPYSGPGWNRFAVRPSPVQEIGTDDKKLNPGLTVSNSHTSTDQPRRLLKVAGRSGEHTSRKIRSKQSSQEDHLLEMPSELLETVGSESANLTRRSKSSVGKKGAELIALEKLDFEDDIQRRGFNFIVQAADQPVNWSSIPSSFPSFTFGPATLQLHTPIDNAGFAPPPLSVHPRVASSWVDVVLLDSNDNIPKLEKQEFLVTLSEDTAPGTILDSFPATDLDAGKNGAIRYEISPTSDPGRLFYAQPSGQIVLRHNLDREFQETHRIYVLVSDSGSPSHTVTATLTVSVKDVNDNPPYIARLAHLGKENGQEETAIDIGCGALVPVKIQENEDARRLASLTLDDPDDWKFGHGPPFQVKIDPSAPAHVRQSFAVKYSQEADNGRGKGVVTSLVPLDREGIGPIRLLPLVLTDNGGQSSTVTLPIIVTDVNDNQMKPASKDVQVVRIEGQHSLTPLGRVYVADPDDWDAGEKVWRWRGPVHPLFALDTATGNLAMKPTTPDGRYFLQFSVDDPRHSQRDVMANVSVVVTSKDLHDVIQPAVALTVSSHSPESLIIKSKDDLHSPLERLLLAVKRVTNSDVHFIALESSHSRLNHLRPEEEIYLEYGESNGHENESKNSPDRWGSRRLQEDDVMGHRNKRLRSSYPEGLESMDFNESRGSRVWISGKGNHSFDQMLLLNVNEISQSSGVHVYSVGLGICGHIPQRPPTLALTHPNYMEKDAQDLQTKLQKVAEQFWLVDANSTAVVTPRVRVSLRCGCGKSPSGRRHHTHGGWVERTTGKKEWTKDDLSSNEQNEPILSFPVRSGDEKHNGVRSQDRLYPDDDQLSSDHNNMHYRATHETLHTSPQPNLLLKQCHPRICLNGGRCIENNESAECICPEGTSPPFCKHLTAHFTKHPQRRRETGLDSNPSVNDDRSSWLWLGTARLCPPVHISLEFRTSDADGTLLYAGPRPQDKGGGYVTWGHQHNEGKPTGKLSNSVEKDRSWRNITDQQVLALPRMGVDEGHPHRIHPFQMSSAPVLNLELKDGRPLLLFSLGSSPVVLSEVPTKTEDVGKNLADGNWHRLDFLWTKSVVELVIDRCQDKNKMCYKTAQLGSSFRRKEQHQPRKSMHDTRTSVKKGDSWRDESLSTSKQHQRAFQSFESVPQHRNCRNHPKENVVSIEREISWGLFNPETPFQVGGVAHGTPDGGLVGWPARTGRGVGFEGCIRFIRINNQLQDLGGSRLSRGVRHGCPLPDPCHVRSCPRNARCSTSGHPPTCQCLPGFRGPLCSSVTQAATLVKGSYAKLALSFRPPTEQTELQIRLRTRSSKGQILLLTSQHRRDRLKLHLSSRKVCLSLALSQRVKKRTAVNQSSQHDRHDKPKNSGTNDSQQRRSRRTQKSETFLESSEFPDADLEVTDTVPRNRKFIKNEAAPPHSPATAGFIHADKSILITLQDGRNEKKSSRLSIENAGEKRLNFRHETLPYNPHGGRPQNRNSSHDEESSAIKNFGMRKRLVGSLWRIRARKQRDAEQQQGPETMARLEAAVREVCLAEAELTDGRWHTIHARSFGHLLELWADDGDHPNYNSSLTTHIFPTQPFVYVRNSNEESSNTTSTENASEAKLAAAVEQNQLLSRRDGKHLADDRSEENRHIASRATNKKYLTVEEEVQLFFREEFLEGLLDDGVSKDGFAGMSSWWNSIPFSVDQQDGVHIGGLPEFAGSELTSVSDDLHESCVDDLRLWGHPLPLPPASNATQAAQLTSFVHILGSCLSQDSCENVSCSDPLQCVDTWNSFACSCGVGRAPRSPFGTCRDVDECQLWSPCLHGQCTNMAPGYKCHCPHTHTGVHCETAVVPGSSLQWSLGAGLGAFVTSFLLIALICGYLILAFIRKRSSLKEKQRLSEPSSASSSPHTHHTHNSNHSTHSGQGLSPLCTPPCRAQHHGPNVLHSIKVGAGARGSDGRRVTDSPMVELKVFPIPEPRDEMGSKRNTSDVDILRVNLPSQCKIQEQNELKSCASESLLFKMKSSNTNEPVINSNAAMQVHDSSEFTSRQKLRDLKSCAISSQTHTSRKGKQRVGLENDELGNRCTCESADCSGKNKKGCSKCVRRCCKSGCQEGCGKLCKKVLEGSYLPAQDDLRDYAYEGDGSTPGSLSSCCSGPEQTRSRTDHNFVGGFQEVATLLNCLSPTKVVDDKYKTEEVRLTAPPNVSSYDIHPDSNKYAVSVTNSPKPEFRDQCSIIVPSHIQVINREGGTMGQGIHPVQSAAYKVRYGSLPRSGNRPDLTRTGLPGTSYHQADNPVFLNELHGTYQQGSPLTKSVSYSDNDITACKLAVKSAFFHVNQSLGKGTLQSKPANTSGLSPSRAAGAPECCCPGRGSVGAPASEAVPGTGTEDPANKCNKCKEETLLLRS